MRHCTPALALLLLVGGLTGCPTAEEPESTPEERFAAAVELQQTGKLEEAIAEYDAVLQAAPQHLGARVNRGLARSDVGQLEGALEDLTAALEKLPDDAELYLARGAVYHEMARYPEALEDYFKAVGLQPLLVDAYRNRAMTWMELEEYGAAAVDLTFAMRLDPDDLELYGARAAAYRAQEDEDSAAIDEVLAQLTEQAATDPDARLQRAMAFVELDEAALALDDIERVLEQDEGHAPAYVARGHLYYLIGDVEQALKDYNRSAELAPELALPAWLGQAEIYQGIGAGKDAARSLEQALKVAPEDADVLARLAWLLSTDDEEAVRDGARAVELAEQAVGLTNEQDWVSLDSLAAALAEEGDFAGAVTRQQQALTLAPGDVKEPLKARLSSYEAERPHRVDQ